MFLRERNRKNIDPTVVIRRKVEMGTGNEILPYSVLIGPLSIGVPGLLDEDSAYRLFHAALRI